jgi:hypothetical protein
MSAIQLYFVLTTLQLLHGTEEYITGFPQRSPELYKWYRRFLPFVPPTGMGRDFFVLLNFGLGAIFLAAALFVAQGQPWALTFAKLVAVGELLHAVLIHILGWIVFWPYFPGAFTSVLMTIASVALLLAP